MENSKKHHTPRPADYKEQFGASPEPAFMSVAYFARALAGEACDSG